MAAEAYRGALQREGGLLPPDQQVGNQQACCTGDVHFSEQLHSCQDAKHFSAGTTTSCVRNEACRPCTASDNNTRSLLVVFFEQESIAYRIAKCCSRCGDIDGAIAGIEQLLYTRNFWSEKYRFGVFLPRLHTVLKSTFSSSGFELEYSSRSLVNLSLSLVKELVLTRISRVCALQLCYDERRDHLPLTAVHDTNMLSYMG